MGCSIVLHENYSLMSTRNPACSFRPRHDTAKPNKGRPEYRAIVTCSIEHKPPLLTLELKRDRRAVALSQMADLNYQRMIIGYHGCDTGVVAKVLSDEDALTPSERDYDWLGNGIYFWEHGPQRAYDWAKDEKTRAPHKIRTRPFSVLISISANASICWIPPTPSCWNKCIPSSVASSWRAGSPCQKMNRCRERESRTGCSANWIAP